MILNYDMKQSGERIRQLRIQSKFTQEMLAKELNIDRSLLSHVEASKRGCSVDLFVRLSNFFNVSLDLLITGKERPTPSNVKDRNMLKSDITELIDHLEAFRENL